MADYATLKKDGESLFKDGKYAECAATYEQIAVEYAEQWNSDEWGHWYYLRALRKVNRSADGVEVGKAFRQLNANSSRINGQYSWCLYDVYMKNPDQENSTNFFKAANKVVEITQQEEYSPYEWIVFCVVDHLQAANNPSYEQIIHWLDKLDPAKLSSEAQHGSTAETQNESYASARERWYGVQTKALIEVKRYDDCITTCTQALADLDEFHYDNDVWFRWRRALAYLNVDQPEQALPDLKQVLKVKKDSFVEHAYARALFALGDNQQALAHAVTSALAAGKVEFKWKLFMLMTRILQALGETNYAGQHALLARQAREMSNPSKDSPELQALLNELQVDVSSAPPASQLVSQLRTVWQSFNIAPETVHQGIIDRVHDNGKSGNITNDNGGYHFFGTRSFKGASDKMRAGQRVGFNLEEVINRKTNAAELHAVDIFPAS